MNTPRIVALLSVLLLTTQVDAQLPLRRGPGFVPRHERVAASILRKRHVGKPAPQLAEPMAISPPVAAAQTTVNEQAPPAPPTSVLAVEEADPVIEAPTSAPEFTESLPIVDEGVTYEVDMGGPCNGCGRCGHCWVDTFSLQLGVAGFKNAVNNGRSGSFGFQEGINWGSPGVFRPLGMNTQLGFRAVQSEFNGTEFDGGSINNDHRSQFFVTAGFFKRVRCGWQGGIVYDFLRDEWIGDVDLGQLRAELSWAVPNGSSFGIWVTSSSTESQGRLLSDTDTAVELDTQDMYAVFYRVQSNQHRLGQWRVFAGATDDGDGLIGSDFKVPLAGTWSLEPEFTYLVPEESTFNGGAREEGWNVAFNLVWYPGRAVRGIDYCRLPLFDVAGNGSMISRIKR